MMADTLTNYALHNAATQTGVDIQMLETMAMIESSGNREVGQNVYGYVGLMQMGQIALADVNANNTNQITWDEVVNNVNTNALAAAEYLRLNSNRLRRRYIPINATNLYLAHQQGVGGLHQLLRTLQTNPNAPLTSPQRSNYYGHESNPTQQDFYNYWNEQVTRWANEAEQYNNSKE